MAPPSTNSSWPCTCAESSEARNSTVFEIWSGSPMRPSGVVAPMRFSNAFSASGVASAAPQIGVRIAPGETTLTRILRGESSDAITRAIARTPAAVVEHLETYLRWVFGFIGIKNPEFISADGIQVGPEHREKAVANALEAASNLNAA